MFCSKYQYVCTEHIWASTVRWAHGREDRKNTEDSDPCLSGAHSIHYVGKNDVMTKLREKSKNMSYAAVNAVGGQERAVWARGHRKCHGNVTVS